MQGRREGRSSGTWRTARAMSGERTRSIPWDRASSRTPRGFVPTLPVSSGLGRERGRRFCTREGTAACSSVLLQRATRDSVSGYYVIVEASEVLHEGKGALGGPIKAVARRSRSLWPSDRRVRGTGADEYLARDRCLETIASRGGRGPLANPSSRVFLVAGDGAGMIKMVTGVTADDGPLRPLALPPPPRLPLGRGLG